MKWKRDTGFDQIDDRRGQGGGGLGGMLGGGGGGGFPIPIPGGRAGGGIGGIIIFVIVLLFSGVLNGGQSGGGGGSLGGLNGGGGQPGGTLNPQSDTDQFVAATVADIQGFWTTTFAESGKQYPQTKLVLFDSQTQSGCGPASAATGPFYCPADQKVYLDLSFFDELKTRFGAKGGDLAIAYVIAHEFGHHVQNVLGISDSVQQQTQQDPARQNDLSVRTELQADCLAGVWVHHDIAQLDAGDIDEALSAASAVGDDRIQQSTTGRVDRESWTHGSAAQRTQWFSTGYNGGKPGDCDTFAG